MSSPREAKLVRKETNAFCCIWCRKTKASSFNDLVDGEKGKVHDYIVEKLAVRRLPLSLFATREELAKAKLNSLATPVTSTKMTVAMPVEEKKSSVMFSSKLALHEDTFSNSLFEEISHSLHEPISQNENEEAVLVSEILNKHSSLFTTDQKDIIPKDPDYLPKSTIVVRPPSILNEPQKFPPMNNAHRTDGSIRETIPLFSKREPTPSLQRTINALGLIQRPHILGMCPPNQKKRSQFPIAMKEEICNIMSGEEEIWSREMACDLLESTDNCYKEFGETGPTTSSYYNRRDYKERESNYKIDSGGQTATKDPKRVTEINQLKGQSLKWKIIIKHRSEKKKAEGE